MLDLLGTDLSAEERELLLHPQCGGVVLFTRNYVVPDQLADLCATLHALKSPPLLIAVDHEGGPVQRFRPGFTPLPPCAALGRWHAEDAAAALSLAQACGLVMAWELRRAGVDLSFAPVLDLDLGVSAVIGERAFHRQPETVTALASAYIDGMREAGMAAVGKHFPGHGSVGADSHLEIPIDPRPYDDIAGRDLIPFARLARGALDGIMPAHVVYPAVDQRPAGFSPLWLKRVLRGALGFEGVVVSDDLSMAGAAGAGGYPERAAAALEAGCDVLLVCNNPSGAAQVLAALAAAPRAGRGLGRLRGRPLSQPPAHWQTAAQAVAALATRPDRAHPTAS
jgi:beta-N-acetylhexosaminidase